MAKSRTGGLPDDPDDVVSAARRPAARTSSPGGSQTQQRSNEATEQQGNADGTGGQPRPPGATAAPAAPAAGAAGALDRGAHQSAPPPPPNGALAPHAEPIVVPPPAPLHPAPAERPAAGGRRKVAVRKLLRATVKELNYEWVETQWRTALKSDGRRYANLGEYIDELLDTARERIERASQYR
jgi:hypothetical protein